MSEQEASQGLFDKVMGSVKDAVASVGETIESVTETVKDTVTGAAEKVVDFITVPAAEKAEETTETKAEDTNTENLQDSSVNAVTLEVPNTEPKIDNAPSLQDSLMFKGKGFYEQNMKNQEQRTDEVNVSKGTAGEAEKKMMDNQQNTFDNLKDKSENAARPTGSVASDTLNEKEEEERTNFERTREIERKEQDKREVEQKEQQQAAPVVIEEPAIPVYDKRADYNRDLKQKYTEMGFEVETEKDLDTLIKETQAKYANMP